MTRQRTRRVVGAMALGIVTIAQSACSKAGRQDMRGGDGAAAPATVSDTAAIPRPGPDAPVLVAVGDIADCGSPYDEATADLVDSIAGTVAVLGDNAYEDGSTRDYAECYAPGWGRHKARTKPAVGNHEYHTADARGYFAYFGSAAGEPGKGYYSYDVGAWHIVVLNSNCDDVRCHRGSAQDTWLRRDLAAHATARCTLAYFHHPRFSSGSTHGNDPAVAPLWDALYEHNADVILSAHDHIYERFAPQTPTARRDASRGIRQFIVGTGGRALYGIGRIQRNSEVRNTNTFGVLQLTLGDSSYAWRFHSIAGETFTDAGRDRCH